MLCFLFWLSPCALRAQTLTFDGNTTTTGVQNGDGAWNTTTANWWNGSGNVTWDNSGSTIAAFGINNTTTGGTITATGTLNVGGMKFNSLSGTPTTIAHTITGGTLAFANNAVVELAENSSSGSSGVLFVNLNSTLTGNGLVFQRDATAVTGAQFQYVRFGTANPGLTGVVTLKALSSSRGIFLLTVGPNTLSGTSGVVVENGSTFAPAGSSTVGFNYAMPISLAGTGANNGALRVDTTGLIFSNTMTLTADAAVNTNSLITNVSITGPIVDGTGTAYGFQRLSASYNSTLALSGSSTYRGTTTLGRSGGVAGGVTILDFNTATSPVTDVLYNGQATAGGLTLWGGSTGATNLVLQGKDATANSQRFGAVSVNGTRSNVVLTPGATGGSMELSLGAISRTGSASVSFTSPNLASINVAMSDGLVGTWATLLKPDGNGSWASVSGGKLSAFTGTLATATNTAFSATAGFSTTSDLTLGTTSTGLANSGTGIVTLNTISMTDSLMDRVLDIGTGNSLRVGAAGGVQITAGSRSLTIGVEGTAGTLSTSSAGQVWLTNLSTAGTLTVNSVIANNGTAMTLYVNGSGNTILTGNNTFSGAAQIGSGTLEIRHNNALGTTAGATTVLAGGSLAFNSGISVAEPFSIAGTGTASEGALRNITGDTSLTGLVTLTNPARINSDSGTLTFSAAAATNIISAASTGQTVTFGGAGNIVVTGRLNSTTNTVVKDGAGRLTLGGDNAFTGAVTISAGTLRVTHANALGTTAGATTVAAGATLEFSNVSLAAEPVTLTSTGVGANGGLRAVSGESFISGLVTVNSTARIHAEADTVLNFDAPSGNAIIKDTSASARTLTFGGSGTVNVLDPVAKSTSGSAGLFNIAKDGNGTLNLRSTNTYEGTTAVNAGVMNLDFSAPSSPLTNILFNNTATTLSGGTLQLTGRNGATNAQTVGAFAVQSNSGTTLTPNGATSLTLTTGALTRGFAAVWAIQAGTGSVIRTSGGADNAIINLDGHIFAYFRDAVNGDDWAATDTVSGGLRNVVRLSSISGGHTLSTATTLAGNADIASGVTLTTLAADTTATGLRFAQAQATTITQDATNRALTVGGILVSSTVGANTTTLSMNTLFAAASTSANNPDLPIIQNNTAAPLVINARIVNRTSGLTTTTLAKSGAGTVVLNGANTFTGNIRIYEGAIQMGTATNSTSVEYLLGSGASSGRVILGIGSTANNATIDYLLVVGSGTDNRVVGGASVISTLTLGGSSATSTFSTGFLGGGTAVENNLALVINNASADLSLGASNTYVGKTTIRQGLIQAASLAPAGTASSLGTGASDSIIEMGSITSGTSATATLRHTGSASSTTDRVINLANSTAGVTSVVAVLENTGTGAMKFTSAFTSTGTNTTATRTLRLTGTNTDLNEIVGIGDNGSRATQLEKTGTGTWVITGDSTHTGGTSVANGLLQLGSGGGTGSVNGGPVQLTASTAILKTARNNTLTMAQVISGAGALQVANTGAGVTLLTNANTYAGGTTVTSGALLVGNSSGSATGTGAVTVLSGAMLGGSGTIAPGADQAVRIINGTLSVGNSTLSTPTAGLLELAVSGTGTIQFDSAATLAFDLISGAGLGDQSGTAAAADLLRLTGAVRFGTDIVLRVANPNGLSGFADGDRWKLFDWSNLAGPLTGSFTTFDLPTLGGGLSWDTSQLYTTGTLSVVPEPTRAVLFTLGGLWLLARRRRVLPQAG